MEAVPPLAWVAGLGALADLLLNRVLIKLGHSTWSSDMLYQLDRWGTFARNLSVIAALIVTAFCLGSLSSKRSELPLAVRAGISTFGWLLVPLVALMTVLPLAWTRPELALVVTGFAHATILLLILAGLHWKSSAGTIAALIATLVAAVSGLASTVVSLVGRHTFWQHADRLSNAFHWSGELAYLGIPLAIAFALAIPWGTARGKAAIVVSTLAAAVFAVGMAFWSLNVGNDLPTLVYAATHLDLFGRQRTVLYAIPLGMGWAVTVAAAASEDSVKRQMGAALLMLLSAGYAPKTPSALIMTVAAVGLLARAAVASSRR